MGRETIRKIINDPVYGFIRIPDLLVLKIIDHPFFQRLRRIRQLGLTYLVYPGAQHTRFQHCLGAMHLMNSAIEVLRSKGVQITEEESQALIIAILLHDIGHGPFSHGLEQSLIEGFDHEDLSVLFMEELNRRFEGALSLAIKIFKNQYKKKFMFQLISGQLDMDRMDYLRRDSFFTGVTEGVIGSDRIIKMIDVVDDYLVVEEKGIYSIEKFLIARRLMYWQVYLHKTVLSAELLLVNILKRAKELSLAGSSMFSTPALLYFLNQRISRETGFGPGHSAESRQLLERFACLDDHDMITAFKEWTGNSDTVLSLLCRRLINRNLFRVEFQGQAFQKDQIANIRTWVRKTYNIPEEQADYFVVEQQIGIHLNDPADQNIQILGKDGQVRDVSQVSDMLNAEVLTKNVRKYCLSYPKEYRN